MGQFQSINPNNGETIAEFTETSVSEIPALVERSKKAQKKWAATPIRERAQMMQKVAGLIFAELDSLAELVANEMGKPINSAKGEVKACAALVRREAKEIVEALKDEVEDFGEFTKTLVYDPLGVSVAITPWNFPLLMPIWQILPALVAGNSVLLKPSEETTKVAERLAELCNQILPEDVLIMVYGAGEQGKALVEADVKLITFTGSRQTGIHILQSASKDLKRVILELGGKDPLVVMKGADLEAAAQFAAGNGFRNSGQVCVSTERVYVDNEIYGEFLQELKKQTQLLKLGESSDEEAALGPMVNERQRDLVKNQIEEARASGANIIANESDLAGKGNYIAPTIIDSVNHQMPVMKEETFGPVLGVMPYDSLDQAVELANDSQYGLGAVVFGPAEEARELARRLDSGMIGINKGVSGVPNSPWVGAKDSGYGFHSSPMGHRQFCQVRVISEKKM